MEKKICAVLMAVILCFTLGKTVYTVSATEYPADNFADFVNQSGLCATIRDDQTGDLYYLDIVVEEVDRSDNSVKYGVYIPSRLLNGENTIDGYDNSYSAYCTLKIKYQLQEYSMGISGGYAYLLTEVSGTWAVQVYNVSVTDVSVTYGCSGAGYNGPVTQVNTIEPYWYGGGFSQLTGFTSYVLDYWDGDVGAYMTLRFQMGSTRSWSFTMMNKILNSGTGF